MNNLITKTWKPLLSLLFGVAVMLFWAVPYMAGLCFREQYQMFLFDTGYFLERIVLPGGLADYISEFLVQFYYMPVLGGAFIGLLPIGIQTAVWGLMKQYGAKHDFPGYLPEFPSKHRPMVCHGRPEHPAFFCGCTFRSSADGMDSQPIPQPVGKGGVRTGKHGIGLLVPGSCGIPLCRPDDR